MSRMLPRPLPTGEPGRRYGIYYHTSFWSTGPHLAQGNPPANVFGNYRLAIDAGASEYSMHHVSNVRPFLLGSPTVLRITCALVLGCLATPLPAQAFSVFFSTDGTERAASGAGGNATTPGNY